MRIENDKIFQTMERNFRVAVNLLGSDITIADDIADTTKGLDIDFEIDKTLDDTPNESKITIYNLQPTTYQNILDNTTGIEVYGAFGTEPYSRLFIGEGRQVTQQADEVVNTSNRGFLKIDDGKNTSGLYDIPTTITSYDAGIRYADAIISRSYKGLVNSKKIIQDCVNIMGLAWGQEDELVYPDRQDYYARGKCINVIKNLVARMGANIQISNGFVSIFNTNRAKPDTYGIVLTSENSNRPVIEKINKEKTGWKIETTLLPFLEPGTYCLCDFLNLKGTYRIYRVRHLGNNYGTQGITEVYVD